MKKLLKEYSAGQIDPGGITPVGDDLGPASSLAGGYQGKILVQNPAGAGFDPKNKETRLGMGFEITSKDYDFAKNVAKKYGVDIDKAAKPWQALNKARQNERLQMVKQKGIQMGLVSPDTGIEELPISQNANPQTVLDSPLNQWLWDTIRDPNVGFAKKNQETVKEEIDVSTQQTTQKVSKGKKPKQDFSTAMGFKVDPATENKIKSTIKSAGVKPSGNVYKDLNNATNRIALVRAWRRSKKGI